MITSSKIRITPCSRVSSRSSARKPSRQRHLAPGGARRLEDDGGHVVARLERGGDAARRRRPAAGSVCSTRPAGMPAGTPPSKCDMAPAATPSCQPWKWPTKRITFGLPVKARASRSARCEASVPEAGEAHALGAGDQAVDQLGPSHLQLVRGAPVRAELHLALDRLHHRRMAVAQQQRAVAAEVVDVLVAVDVPLARTRRRARHRSDRAAACGCRASGRPGSPCAPARRARPSAACAPDTRPRSSSSFASPTCLSSPWEGRGADRLRRLVQMPRAGVMPRLAAVCGILGHALGALGQIGIISALPSTPHRRQGSNSQRATLQPAERGGTMPQRNGRSPCPIALH